ncbi:MAG: FtsQ-type POTRA domain-containing protein [Patescibacteria group bacterium]|nr:FtsQ-type POTRA domain-containing protein [Patescibacteria group bacterium]
MATPTQPKLRLKDRRRKLMQVKVVAGTAVVLASLGLLFYVSRLPAFTIRTITVSGTNIVNAADIQKVAYDKLAGSYAFIIPRDNGIVAPVSNVRGAILAAFPPVADVSIARQNLTALDIKVTERKPAALWCNTPTESPTASCYAVDSGGFIFVKDPGDPTLVRYYGMIEGEPIGTRYLNGNFRPLSQTVADIAASLNRTPETVSVDPQGNVALDFKEGGELRFTESANRQLMMEDIASVFASEDFKTHPQFEYVDFRFGDKVYVKFK